MDPEFYGVIGACAAIVILILKIYVPLHRYVPMNVEMYT